MPAFKGLNTHQRAIDGNAEIHGVSVHLVNEALDDGPMIIQAWLSLLADDTADSLARRVLELEHQIYPFVLFALAKKFLYLSTEGVIWRGPSSALANSPAQIKTALSPCVIWPTTSAEA